ncbi:hypothetical protein [Spongiactinospora sp. TRM90649]|uniref:hypothetical protein n=1 Tax=Spongiactinospora sp. TRM90649 TaxID=3031114 RepID=UPI0023F8D753|nr:hypothetical protein [Spongiactinospora sp. TRM90649]MDF5752588.1 hypothetical protein [Spongiactinospora sp. TRM90649]
MVAAKVADVLPGYFTGQGLPAPSAAQVDLMKDAVAYGQAPVTPDLHAQVAQAITTASDQSFLDGMHLAYTVSTVVAVVAALLVVFVRAGRRRRALRCTSAE